MATKRLEETTNSVNGTVEGLGSAVDDLRKRLEDIRSPEQSIEIKLQPALKTIQNSVDTQIDSMSAHLELNKSQAKAIDRALAPISEMAASIKGSAQLMDKASTAGMRTQGAINHLIEKIDKLEEFRSQPGETFVQHSPNAQNQAQSEEHQPSSTPEIVRNDKIAPRVQTSANERWLSWLIGR